MHEFRRARDASSNSYPSEVRMHAGRGAIRISVPTFALLILVSAGALWVAFHFQNGNVTADLGTIERDPPVIAWKDLPKGLSATPIELSLEASDSGTGIGQILVVADQGSTKTTILDTSYSDGKSFPNPFKVPINARALGLKEGDVVLTATVTDRSIWKNATTIMTPLKIAFTPSRVEVLSTQQNGTVGGSEFVIFRLVGHALVSGGAQIGERVYDSYPVATFDLSMGGMENVFASLFPIPFDFNPDTGALKLNVTDGFGAVLNAPFNYRIAKKKFASVDMKLTDQFVNRKVPELLQSLQTRDPSKRASGDNYHDFKLINEDLRRLNEAEIQKAIKESSVKERLWSGVFIRPLAAAPKAVFAEHRSYKRGTEFISESVHMGIDLADVVHAPVHAANRGQIIFIGELGIYGQAIIIDHGTGVVSLYGHLSSIGVQNGDIVDSGHEIARTGATGLAGGDHLHFEIRVQGVPVSPYEWWDPLWIKQHVEGKLRDVLAPTEEIPAPVFTHSAATGTKPVKKGRHR